MKRTVRAWASVWIWDDPSDGIDGWQIYRTRNEANLDVKRNRTCGGVTCRAVPCTITYDDGLGAKRASVVRKKSPRR